MGDFSKESQTTKLSWKKNFIVWSFQNEIEIAPKDNSQKNLSFNTQSM